MEENGVIAILVAAVTALGVKEIWNIWKKKIDVKAQLDQISLHNDHESLKTVIDAQRGMIDALTEKIEELEKKIDILIKENKSCAVKLARLEERLTENVASKERRSATKKSSKKVLK